MSKAINWIFFFLISISVQAVHAQNIKIISGNDSAALAYATITNHTNPFVCSADKNGLAKIEARAGDTISVSFAGYTTASFQFDNNDQQLVRLFQLPKNLPSIIVHNCKKTKKLKYTNAKRGNEISEINGVKRIYSGVIWSSGKNLNPKIAVRINPLNVYSTLKEFSFWIVKEIQAPDSSVLAPLLISFYEVADSNNLPGDLISQDPIVYFPEKAGKQTLYIDTLHISIPPAGIYVSLQYILNEEYEWKQAIRWKDNEKDSVYRDTIIIRYGGRMDGSRSENFDLVFYNWIKKEWFSASKKPVPNNAVNSTIKCEAIIKYCGDN